MFVLAETLGRTVTELESTMDYDEFLAWAAFFELREQERENERKKGSGGKRKKG